MHLAHAQARSYTGMAISCVDLISVCRMHFLGLVISPQGSARGCHESRRLYCYPPLPPPILPPLVDNHRLASRTWQIQQPFLITPMNQVTDWLSGFNNAYGLFSFLLWFFVVFFGAVLSSEILSKWLRCMFWNANTCPTHENWAKTLNVISFK